MNFSQLGFGFFVLKINGILIALIFSLGILYYYKELQKEKLNLGYFIHHLWRWVVGGLIGGRLFALILDFNIFNNYGILSPLAFWDGGINFYGALFFALGIMFYDLKKSSEDPWKWIDLMVPAILLRVIGADIEEFITGVVYGTETSLFWGVQYETFGVDSITPVHPVTIYAFIIHIILLNWVLKFGKQFYRQKGNLVKITAIMFFFAEFFLQFFRGDPTLIIFNTLRIEQVFSIIIIAVLTISLQKK